MISRVSLWIALSVYFAYLGCSNAAPKLAGDRLTLKDAVSQSIVIFVGRTKYVEAAGNITDSGVLSYYGTEVQILKILKGSVKARSNFTLYDFAVPRPSEEPPKIGVSYVFFVKKNIEGQYDPYIIIKLIPATNENIAMVEKLIFN